MQGENDARSDRAIHALIAALRRLPGMSQRRAAELAPQLAGRDPVRAWILARLIAERTVAPPTCSRCHALSPTDPCAICADPVRELRIVRVVEDSLDLCVLESRGDYQGVYHVLDGYLSPLDGIGPGDLRIAALVGRVREEAPAIAEIRIAVRDDIPGDATAIYLWKALQAPGGPAIIREPIVLPPRP